eukprot:GFUD01014921.1.p1 GENE.GFUD01014921.1~~GFUD01014921.1.p1  ORF type:complete len:287 (+),score=52.21 GFUD01014921.1:88-948(+)
MTDPNIQTIDLMAGICDISPNPTYDISFTFVDQTTGETSELFAHKLVLACGSPVFMRQFYGEIKEQKNPIPVEDSSSDAFKFFLDTLYNKKPPLKNMDFQLLGKMYYLADKYLLELLKESVTQEVSSRKMVTEKVIEAAQVAELNVHLEKFASAVFHKCTSFVRDNPESVLQIFDNEEAGEERSYTLHRLMAKTNRTEPKQPPRPMCDNCKHEPCLHGKVLTENNFVAGALICYISNPSMRGFRKTIRKLCGGSMFVFSYYQTVSGKRTQFTSNFSAISMKYKCVM